MGREAPEEEHEVLLGIDDRTRRSTATATAAQDPQLDPTKDGGVLATFRRRLRNEDPPDRSGEQASDGDEPRAAKSEPLPAIRDAVWVLKHDEIPRFGRTHVTIILLLCYCFCPQTMTIY